MLVTMSLRPELVTDKARTFSLNEYFQNNATPIQQQRRLAPAIFKPTEPVAFQASAVQLGLNLKLPSSHIVSANKQSVSPSCLDVNTKSSIPHLSLTLATLGRNTADRFPEPVKSEGDVSEKRISAGYVHGGNNSSNEVLRLTADLYETRTRLEHTKVKLTASETSVCRANNALLAERAASSAHIAHLTNENKALQKSEDELRVQLSQTSAAIKSVHDDEIFKIHANGALEVENENEKLKAAIIELKNESIPVKEDLKNLKMSNGALQASYDQLASEYAAISANREALMLSHDQCKKELLEVKEHKEQFQTTNTRLTTELADALSKSDVLMLSLDQCKKELHDEKDNSKKLSEAVTTSRLSTIREMEAKLEATETRYIKSEKDLTRQLEEAHEQCQVARTLAENNEKRSIAAEDFVRSVSATDASLSAAADTTTATSLPGDENTAQCGLRALKDRIDMNVQTLEEDPHSIRKQMRVAALSSTFKDMNDLMRFGNYEPQRTSRATSDMDTSEGCCCPTQPFAEIKQHMATNAYPNTIGPYDAEEMSLAAILHANSATGGTVPIQGTEMSNRITRLIDATKKDLASALEYEMHVHAIAKANTA